MANLLRYLAVGVLLVLLHVIGASSAHAQTATPTPVPTLAPAPTVSPHYGLYGNVFPGGYNDFALYGCEGHGTDAQTLGTIEYAWNVNAQCTILDTQFVDDGLGGTVFLSDEVHTGGVTSGSLGPLRSEGWLFFVAPIAVLSYTIGCDLTLWEGGLTTNNVTQGLMGGIAGWSRSPSSLVGSGLASQSTVFTVVRTGSAASSHETLFDDYAALTGDFVQTSFNAPFKYSTYGYVTSGNRDNTQSLTCRITGMWLADNSPVSPSITPTPVATATPMVTPTTCYIGCGGTPIAYVPISTPLPWVSTPAPIDFSVTPGVTTCFVIIPAFSWGVYTVFGYDLGFSWAAFELCAEENSISWVLFDIDFGAWATGLLLVAAVGVLYSRLK